MSESKPVRTNLQAHCMLGVMAGGGAFVPTSHIVTALNEPNGAVLSALSAVKSRVMEHKKRAIWIENKPGYGWHIYGRSDDLDWLYFECMSFIADDAASIAADKKAGQILASRRAFATPSAYCGLGA